MLPARLIQVWAVGDARPGGVGQPSSGRCSSPPYSGVGKLAVRPSLDMSFDAFESLNQQLSPRGPPHGVHTAILQYMLMSAKV